MNTPIIEVKKRNRETAGALMRRFARKVQQAGVVRQARANQFRIRPLSNKKKKNLALRRIVRGRETVRLKKLGRIALGK